MKRCHISIIDEVFYMQPLIETSIPLRYSTVRPTTFYPTYGAGKDYVSRVYPVERVAFQKVFPRYDLSTTLTRDTGLGPLFERISHFPQSEEADEEFTTRTPRGGRKPTYMRGRWTWDGKGRYIDVLV
jgi:hypothetical protein